MTGTNAIEFSFFADVAAKHSKQMEDQKTNTEAVVIDVEENRSPSEDPDELALSPLSSERDQGSDDQFPRNLAKGRPNNSLSGSVHSSGVNGGASDHNSDNSELNGLDNSYFGFNFDTEEGMMKYSNMNSEEDQKNESENGSIDGDVDSNNGSIQPDMSHAEAAAAAVANLQSIVNSFNSDGRKRSADSQQSNQIGEGSEYSGPTSSEMRYENEISLSTEMSDSEDRPRKRGKKHLDENKREERNAREKERSFRISRQINELRNLLSTGGVIVPKGTKSSVLTEAANYIRILQQHQYRSEIDRHQLVQQMQMIGGGALGPKAAQAVRHVAAQNGVWSLGNFGGVPPKSAMQFYQGPAVTSGTPSPEQATSQPHEVAHDPLSTKIAEHDYRFVFNSCSVGMAIASMGGAFIDCNQLFCSLSNFSKQEVCSMTIFNLTSRQDLQHAFDLISQMISPPTEGMPRGSSKPCVLRGAMKSREDIGLNVALIRGDDGIAKCFCVTLIQNPESPFDQSKPVPATLDLVNSSITALKNEEGNLNSSPAYTTG